MWFISQFPSQYVSGFLSTRVMSLVPAPYPLSQLIPVSPSTVNMWMKASADSEDKLGIFHCDQINCIP